MTTPTFVIRPCRCDCWFCADCCAVKSQKLKHRLITVLSTFHDIEMVTLTVDPHLFPCPRQAYAYLTRRRCVSRTVAELHRRKLTHTNRFFSTTEWQDQTGQVHFHVLLDATNVHRDRVFDAWSKHRPPDAGPVQPDRPPLGWVDVKAPLAHVARDEAAWCAAAYLTKVPSHGFPEWVMGMGADRRVRRYSTSRGFWTRPRRGPPRRPSRTRTTAQGPRPKRSYANRVSDCARSINVFRTVEQVDLQTGETVPSERWVAEVAVDDAAGCRPDAFRPLAQDVRNAGSLERVLDVVEQACGAPARILRLGRPRRPAARPQGVGSSGHSPDGDARSQEPVPVLPTTEVCDG